MTGPVLVLGLSEAASAVAHRLHRAGLAVALAAHAPPKVHRRAMAFADAWWDGTAALAGLACVAVAPDRLATGDWPRGRIPLLRLPPEAALALRPWPVAVDARLAKRAAPLALRGRAGLAIGCGPGHVAGGTCDLAVETRWGDDLGAVIARGPTAALAGEPRPIEGIGRERIVYAACAGPLTALRAIGDPVGRGEILARIGAEPVAAPIAGTLRGILRDGIAVAPGDKLCEIDPRPPDRAVFRGIGARPAAIAAGVARAIARGRPAPPPRTPAPIPEREETRP